MTLNDAVAARIRRILKDTNRTQYDLEVKSGIQHGTMQAIMSGKNKTVTLSTVYKIAKGCTAFWIF